LLNIVEIRHGPECRILVKEKKELWFDPQTKRKKFAMIQALFALYVSFFCKTSVYLFIVHRLAESKSNFWKTKRFVLTVLQKRKKNKASFKD
jgi:hypothetical protein